MAAAIADSDSDYGWDLSIEDEQLLANLAGTAAPVSTVAAAPAQRPERPEILSRRLSNTTTATTITTTTATSYGLSSDSESTRRYLLDAAATIIDEDAVGDLALQQHPDPPTAPTIHNAASRHVARRPPAAASDTRGATRVPGGIKGKSPASRNTRASAEYAFITKDGPQTVPLPDPVAVDVSYPDLTGALSSLYQDNGPEPDAIPETLQPDPPRKKASTDASLSPLVRFRTYPRKPLSVSDITAGAWCELQQEYTLKYLPGGKKTRTAAMKAGSKVHQKLEDEVHTTVKVDVMTKEDAFGLKLWNVVQGLRTLREEGLTRELEVWGIVDGEVVNGIIDVLTHICPDTEMEEEVRSSQGSKQASQEEANQPKITDFMAHQSPPVSEQLVYIADVKTRGSRKLPSGPAVRPSTIQLFLYHRMLSEMASDKLDFHRVLRRYGLNADLDFSDTFIAQIGSLHDEIFFDAESTNEAEGSVQADDPRPEIVRYTTIRKLLDLLRSELRLTFPSGAASIGPLVTVQYHLRQSAQDPAEDPEAYTRLGTNVIAMNDRHLDAYLENNLKWWRGERSADGVPIEEAPMKCRWCDFADRCEWRQKQDKEWLRRATEKLAFKGSGIQVEEGPVPKRRRRSSQQMVPSDDDHDLNDII